MFLIFSIYSQIKLELKIMTALTTAVLCVFHIMWMLFLLSKFLLLLFLNHRPHGGLCTYSKMSIFHFQGN